MELSDSRRRIPIIERFRDIGEVYIYLPHWEIVMLVCRDVSEYVHIFFLK